LRILISPRKEKKEKGSVLTNVFLDQLAQGNGRRRERKGRKGPGRTGAASLNFPPLPIAEASSARKRKGKKGGGGEKRRGDLGKGLFYSIHTFPCA